MPRKRLQKKANSVFWDLTLLFSDPAINNLNSNILKTTRAVDKFQKKWSQRTDFTKNSKALKQALDDYNNLYEFYGTGGKVNYYLYLKYSLNQSDNKTKALLNKIDDAVSKNITKIQFFELNLAKISKKQQALFLKNKLLLPYKHFLKRVFDQGKYNLSDKEERILVLKSQVSHSNWTRMISSFLAKEERNAVIGKKLVKKNFSELIGLTSSKETATNKSAAEGLDSIFSKYVEVAEHEINSILQNKKINDELRKFERPDKARHLSDDIDTEVIDTLVGEVTNNFDLANKYYEFRAKLFGKKKILYHEKQVEYGKVDKKYTFEKGVAIIQKVFEKLDPEFKQILTEFLNQNRVDVYPKKGKRGGAFATHNLITQPTYLLLNWADRLTDVMTFAHELGHGINYELARKTQNALNYGVTLSTTEVASTFMEDFVNEELTKDLDNEEKLSFMVAKLDNDVATIFRQIAFYNFEKQLHESFRKKGYLSYDELGKMFTKHIDSYLGSSVVTKGYENWWVYISHFRSFFYVYSYANGQLISKALQAKVRNNPNFIQHVKNFLSSGLSDSPKNIFAKMGLDITDKHFWKQGLTEIENYFNQTKGLAKHLGKL